MTPSVGMKDLQGREYLTSSAKAGDWVETDGDFTCLEKGAILQIQGGYGGLWIPCREDRHYLDGHLSEDGTHYIGLYPAEVAS